MSKKLRIAFFTLGLPLEPNLAVESQSIGGSESALLYLSRELAFRGHDVEVYCNLKDNKHISVEHEGSRKCVVDFYPANDFTQVVNSRVDYDVVVSMRFHQSLVEIFPQLNAKMVLYWNHDMPLEDEQVNLSYMMFPDRITLLSQFHFDEYKRYLRHLEVEKHVFLSKNGVDLNVTDAFYNARQGSIDKVYNEDPLIFLYGSRPERGCEILLKEIWGRIHEQLPNSELWISTYTFDKESVHSGYRETYNQIDIAKLVTPGVKFFEGGLTKEEWYTTLANAAGVLYPTNFPEISCILAMEAQAIGVPIITTDNFALSETVKPDIYRIKGNPYTKKYQDIFVDRVLDLFGPEGKTKRNKAIKFAYDSVKKEYGWDQIAEDWEKYILDFFEERYTENQLQIFNSFFQKNDYVCASKVLEDIPETYKGISTLKEKMVKYKEFADATQGVKDPLSFEYEVVMDRFKLMINHTHTQLGLKDGKEPKDISIIDLGCGYGECITQFTKAWSPYLKEAVGVDLDTSYAKGYTKKFIKEPLLNKVRFEEHNLYKLMKGDDKIEGKFDIVVLGEVLEHFEENVELMELCERLCKPNGVIVISTPTGFWNDQHHRQIYNYSDFERLLSQKDNFMITHLRAPHNERGRPRGNYILSWKNNPTKKKFIEIDYETKIKRERPLPIVSMAMIVKNEQDDIGKAVRSAVDYVDEIHITDTGSTDRTWENLEALQDDLKTPIYLHLYNWNDSFEDARNASVKDCKGDWIFWMDADEILYNGATIDYFLRAPYFNGYAIEQRQVAVDMKQGSEYPCRLFKRFPNPFIGIIHEQPAYGPNTPIKPQITLPDVVLLHMGYTTEGIRVWKSRDRNLSMLIRDMEKYPDRKVGIILIMRDLLHIARWETQANKGMLTKKAYKYYLDIIKLYENNFEYEEDESIKLPAKGVYTHCMEELGIHQVPINSEGRIPFEIGFGLKGAIGGFKEDEQVEISKAWVRDKEDLEDKILDKVDELWEQAGKMTDRRMEPLLIVEETLPQYRIPEELYSKLIR